MSGTSISRLIENGIELVSEEERRRNRSLLSATKRLLLAIKGEIVLQKGKKETDKQKQKLNLSEKGDL